jgi:hypothetical protein
MVALTSPKDGLLHNLFQERDQLVAFVSKNFLRKISDGRKFGIMNPVFLKTNP